MAIEVFNRTEKKYSIDTATFNVLRERMKPYMNPDKYNADGGCYMISNIYYDTPDNELIRRSVDKPIYKEKLRLRGYGKQEMTDKVFLEIKKKYKGVVNKRRTKIYLSDAYRFVKNGEFTNADGSKELPDFMNKQVTDEIKYFIDQYKGLQPALYLSYERYAMFSKTDFDLRITFDKNITTRRYDLGLHYGNYGDKLLPEDTWIMEIKVNKAMPMWLADLLSELKIYPTSYSKYGTEYANYIAKRQEVMSCLIQFSSQTSKKEQLNLVHR